MITDAEKLARYDDLANLVDELHDENMKLRHSVSTSSLPARRVAAVCRAS